MNEYEFYKSKFDRELNRRTELDTAINNPIAGITITVGLNSYILSNNDFKDWETIDINIIILLIISTLNLLISLYYIFLSNNNLFKGFSYPNFGLLIEFRNFQNEINIYNSKVEEIEHRNFESHIIEKIIELSDSHTEINDIRGFNLYHARKYVIIAFILTVLNILFLTFNNIYDMNSNNVSKKPSEISKPLPKPEPPKMPANRIEKGQKLNILNK